MRTLIPAVSAPTSPVSAYLVYTCACVQLPVALMTQQDNFAGQSPCRQPPTTAPVFA